MNFGQVANLPPNSQGIMMQAVLNEIKEQGNNKNGKPFMKCVLTDTIGVKHKTTIYKSRDGFPTQEIINQKCNWTLSSFDTQYGKVFSGFFGGLAQSQAPPQTNYQSPPPQQPQTPQNQPQSTQAASPTQAPSQDDVKRYRSTCLAYAKDLVIVGRIIPAVIYEQAEEFRVYVETGKIPAQAVPVNEEQEPQDATDFGQDDPNSIPF